MGRIALIVFQGSALNERRDGAMNTQPPMKRKRKLTNFDRLDIVDDGVTFPASTRRLRLLRDDLPVFPNIERRAIHARDFLSIFGGATQRATNTRREIFVFPS